jgi:outer membrane protein assembly factor BamE (lipoprotein component of BamABCDE complex)
MEKSDKWFYGTIVFAAVLAILSMSSCSVYKARVLNEMVQNGQDPLRASCALYDDRSQVCAIIATK